MKKSSKKTESVRDLINEIHRKFDNIEDLMAWQIRAEQRFKKGQRVEFSRSAARHHVAKAKHGVKKGTVLKVDGFCITVLLDGYKTPQSYQHSFFNPVIGNKLF